ncbi:MAG: hypothetical protein A3F72_05050 [Bacteroidetes bacterium RIFCSPLOWO2_12_FULL_35_15]|nr:MAG: hypothetical protein A3F72_05050 [Bacteroidetes bacterium RIFCSPLOWO2_12_FULL_35_15]
MPSIKNQISSGIKWNFIGQFGRQIIFFITSLILARLLSVNEFGLIAMLSVFISFGEVFIHSGLGAGLINKKDASEKDFSTVFYFNIAISVAIYLIMLSASPYIARLYKQPELENIIYILCLIFIINAIGMTPNYVLVKKLEFKRLNIISLYSVLLSAPVAIIFAFNGMGVYSLVFQTISYSLINNFLLIYYSKWKPTEKFSAESFKRLFKFGMNILIAYLIEKVLSNVDTLLIGKKFNPSTLGYFSRAKSTRDLSLDNTSNILTNIIFPIFSKIHDNEELKRVHLKFYKLLTYINFPITVGLLLIANPLIIILFTEKWSESVLYFKLLCIPALTMPLIVIIQQTILSRGKSNTVLAISIINRGLYALSILIGIQWGINEALFLIAISSVITFVCSILFSKIILGINPLSYLIATRSSLILSIIMAVCVFSISKINFSSIYLELSILISSGIIVYVGISYLFKVEEFMYLKNELLKKIKRKA